MYKILIVSLKTNYCYLLVKSGLPVIFFSPVTK